jgi:hypothetical protein
MLAAFISLVSLVSLYALEGDFAFQGEMSTLQVQRIELIPSQAGDAAQKLSQLKEVGYQCERRAQFYRCRVFVDPAVTEPFAIKPQVEAIHFGEVQGTEVLNDSDSLLQYESFQEVRVNGEVFDKALYTLMKPQGLLKITVPDREGRYHFIVRDEKTLGQLHFPRRKLSQWISEHGMIEVSLSTRAQPVSL